MTDIRIKNTNLNGGSYVNLQGASFSFGLKKMTQVEPIAGQRKGSTTTFTISKGDRNGIENPVIQINGLLNTNDFATSAALWNSTTTDISLAYLYGLWRDLDGTTILNINFGVQDSSGSAAQFAWRPFDSSATDEIPIEIDSINFQPRDDSDGLHIISYQISAKEVRTS